MLRQGKSQGWLSLPSQAFTPWAHLNGVQFHDVKPGHIEGRGSALIASKAVTNSADGAECLLTVPKDLILSLEQILEQAKVDRDFREVLESLGDFGRVGHSCSNYHSRPQSVVMSASSAISWAIKYSILCFSTFPSYLIHPHA
jgi:hypothetical protein